MRKSRCNLFFEKRYCLLIHSVTINQKISIATGSHHSLECEILDRPCTYNINQIVYINCIDSIQDGVTTPDNQPTVRLTSCGEKNMKKFQIGSVRFDMNHQKIVKPDTPVMFSKDMEGGRGTINYKFINLKTKNLSHQEFQSHKSRKSQLEMQLNVDEETVRMQNLMRVLKQKNQLNQQLQRQIQDLIAEKQQTRINETVQSRHNSKQKYVQIELNINKNQQNLRKEIEKLKILIEQETENNKDLTQQIAFLKEEKEIMEKQFAMAKKQFEKVTEHYQTKKGRASFINDQNSFLRQSLAEVQQLNQQNNFRQSRTKITITEPPSRISRRSHSQQESNIHGKTNVSKEKKIDQQQKLNSQSAMLSSNFIPRDSLTPSHQPIEKTPKQGSQGEGSNPTQSYQNQLQRRISIQNDDFRWNSLMFEQKEELQILRKKYQINMSQNKNTEKELERCRQLLKKKELQIRQLKSVSRRNLLNQSSSKDLKNRSAFQIELEKMNSQYELERASMQEQSDKLQKQLQQRNKEIKNLRVQYQQTKARQKTFEDRYNQIKAYSKKISEESIQNRQKAILYDNILIRNKQLQEQNQTLSQGVRTSQQEINKLTNRNNFMTNKIKQLDSEVQRLKKLQRQSDYVRNQLVTLTKAKDTLEHRNNELKKHCMKIQSIYNQHLGNRKKNVNFSQYVPQTTEQKEINEKFSQFYKKVNQYQINYFAQQIQDFKDEIEFIKTYYQKKKKQERDKIKQSKDMSQTAKSALIASKQIEYAKYVNEKVSEISKKIQEVERSYQNAQYQTKEGRASSIISLPQKIRKVQQKLVTLMEKDNMRSVQRNYLKETIFQMKQTMKQTLKPRSNKSDIEQQADLIKKQSSNHLQMLNSMLIQSRQKKNYYEQARMKQDANQLKAYEQNRKMNTTLVKQNGQLKMQVQRMKMEAQKADRKAQERQKNMETSFKKSQFQTKIKIEKLTEQVEKATDLLQKTKIQSEDHRAGVQNLTEELAKLSDEVVQKDLQIGTLNERVDQLQDMLRDYEKAEKRMREQVQEIKKKSQLNEKQFISLMQVRSEQFLKIQLLKQQQVKKLKQAIQELEIQLEHQMDENFKHIETNETLKQKLQQQEKQSEIKIQQFQVLIQSKSKEIDELYMKEYISNKENDSLKASLLDISTSIEQIQMSNVELNYKIQSLQKQNQLHEKQAKQYQQHENILKQKIQSLEANVKDKAYQIKYFQQKFQRVQFDIELSQKEMVRVSTVNEKYQIENKEFHQKYMAKQQQIIKLKQQISFHNIENKQNQYKFEQKDKQNNELKKQIEELHAQIIRLNQTIGSLNQRKLSGKQSNADLQVSNQLLSPSKPNSRIKKYQSLEVPEFTSITVTGPQLNFGGITPITPLNQSAGFPKKHQSIELKQENSSLLLRRKNTQKQIAQQKFNENKDQTLIKIQVEEIEQSYSSNLPSFPPIPPEEQICKVTAQNLMKTNSPMDNFIRQDTEEQQIEENQNQHNFNFNSKGDEQDQNLTQTQAYIIDLQQKIKILEHELKKSNEQNQRLNNQIYQIQQKMIDTAQLGNQNPTYRNSEPLNMQPLSPNLLKKTSTFRASREIALEDDVNSKELKARSQSGRDKSLVSHSELQHKLQQAELEIQSMNDQLTSLKRQIQQHSHNNERLIQQAQACHQTIQNMQDLLEEAHFQAEQNKAYIVFEEKYKQEVNKVKEYYIQVQQLTAQILQKQNIITELHNENNQIMEKVNGVRTEANTVEQAKEKLQKQIKEMKIHINKMKLQYRKYQQDSQLEIVHLREQVDHLKVQVRQRKQENVQLAEKYLEIQNEKNIILTQLEQYRNIINNKDVQVNQYKQKSSKFNEQMNKIEQSRQALYKIIKKLQMQVMEKSETIKNMVSDSSLIIKKYQIKLQSNKNQMIVLNQKLNEKQKVINLLKNQIALYNQECSQLKSSNEALQYELIKVEKELKDIMQVYEGQIGNFRSELQKKDKNIVEINVKLKQKQVQISNISKQLRNAQKQRDVAKAQELQNKTLLQKIKQSKTRENGQLTAKLQFTNNQLQKIKLILQKNNQQLQHKDEQIKQLQQKRQIHSKSYKQKYFKYEQMIEDFHQQLKKVEERPTSQAYQQVTFENQLLRNQIEQLKDQLTRNSSRDKQEHLYAQFRKYKVNKEREIQDLQAQMEKYGIKINQLEESIFYLKKQNQSLTKTNISLRQQKDQLQLEYQDQNQAMAEISKELEFYKKRKMLDMQKLLNDTQ